MGYPPKIGRSASLSSAAEELTHLPGAEDLGTLSPDALKDLLTEPPPPPWETDPRFRLHDSDARRYVTGPDSWEFRWLSERMIAQEGMRNWEAVSASDPRVTVHHSTMVAPDNTIRKGDHRHGDLLCWMWKRWVESRNAQKREKVRKRTGAAMDRQEAVREQINRGSFGPYVHVDSAVHPTHTTGEGRSFKD